MKIVSDNSGWTVHTGAFSFWFDDFRISNDGVIELKNDGGLSVYVEAKCADMFMSKLDESSVELWMVE